MAGNSRIKNYFNDLISDSVTSRPFTDLRHFLPDYFSTLQNAAFWIEAGNYPELDNTEVNPGLLEKGIMESLPGVSAVNYASGRSRMTYTLSEGKITATGKPFNRRDMGHYIMLENNNFDENIYLTDFDILESTGELGFSTVIELRADPPVSLSLDISLAGLAEHYQKAFNEKAILFLASSTDEFITLPLDTTYLSERKEGGVPGNDERFLTYQELVKVAQSDPHERPYFIDYEGKPWYVIPLRLNDYGGEMGFILPESALFFGQNNNVYFIAAVPLLILFLLLFSLFIYFQNREKQRIPEELLLQRLIDKGESRDLEFKSSLRWDYRENTLNKKLEEIILKSIAAFANAQGGTLLIGVDDDGNILGLKRDYVTLKHHDRDGFELHLRNMVSAMYGTFTIKNMEVSFVTVQDKEVCRIHVSPSRQPLYTVMKNKSGEKQEQFYIRDGNLSRRIDSLKDIMEYCSKRFR